MKTSYFLKMVVIVFASLSLSIPLAYAKTTREAHQGKQIKYLFVQAATSAKIEAHKEHKNQYLLTLIGISPYVSYFSDRPYRTAGHMKVEKFENLWKEKGKDSFQVDPPNAELVAIQLQPEDKVLNYTVELTKPRYDKKAGTVTYIVKPVKGSEMPLPVEATLNHVFLFIDDVCLSCWGF